MDILRTEPREETGGTIVRGAYPSLFFLHDQEMEGVACSELIINPEVLFLMPLCNEGEVEVFFFKITSFTGCLDNHEVERQYKLRNLKPDPLAQAAVNTFDLSFADTHPNVSTWENTPKGMCYMLFSSENGGRRRSIYMDFYPSGVAWDESYWFAGVKIAPGPSRPMTYH